MRKLALMFGALGFIAFTGLANADEKTENTVKTESSTTLGGKHKVVKTKKVVAPDGTTTESKTEVVTPKTEKRDLDTRAANTRDNGVVPVRHDDKARSSEVSEKTEEHTTLTGKHQTKSTKKVERPDGTQTESTTTTTEPNKK